MDSSFVRDRITQLRLQMDNVSERKMSLDLGNNEGYINTLTSIKKDNLPSLTELFYICEYLGVELNEFFNMEKSTSLLQQEAISCIYDLVDKDIAFFLEVLKRLKLSNNEERVSL